MVARYESHVKIIPSVLYGTKWGNVGDNARTTIIKVESEKSTIESVEYINGKIYNDVRLIDINIYEYDIPMISRIRDKITKGNDAHLGNVGAVVVKDYSATRARLGSGAAFKPANGQGPTIINPDLKLQKSKKYQLGVKVDFKYQIPAMHAHLELKISRFAHSLEQTGAYIRLGMVPMCDPHYVCNDQWWYEHFKFTKAEIAFIERTIPDIEDIR